MVNIFDKFDQNLLDEIEKKLHHKGIDIFTQDEIVFYIYLNQKLFHGTIKIDQLIDRIVSNLDRSIKCIDNKENQTLKDYLLQGAKRFIIAKGEYYPYSKKIMIDQLFRIKSLFPSKSKQTMSSVIRHELEHCATTSYISVGMAFKERLFKHKKFNSFLHLSDSLETNTIAICGINDERYLITEDLDLTILEEGITSYIESLYNKMLGQKVILYSYIESRYFAKFLAETIGLDNLALLRFNHDYESIKKMFAKETGKDLSEVVRILNEQNPFNIIKLRRFINGIKKRNNRESLRLASKNPIYDPYRYRKSIHLDEVFPYESRILNVADAKKDERDEIKGREGTD